MSLIHHTILYAIKAPTMGMVVCLGCALFSGAAGAQSCVVQEDALNISAQHLAVEQVEVQELAAQVEAAGEAWQNATGVASVSDAYALIADEQRQNYDALKSEFEVRYASHMDNAENFNVAVAHYNKKCAPPKP